MADLTIYGFPLSTYVWTVRITAEEKGVDYEIKPVRPGSDEIFAVHPFGKMPAIDHGDFHLFETSAICRYIDEAFDGPALCPADTKERAVMEQWVSAFRDHFYDPMVRRCVLEYVFPRGEDGNPDKAAIDAAVPDMAVCVSALEAGLDGRTWLAGDGPSIADFVLAPMIYYLGQMPEGRTLLAGQTNIARWRDAMFARESFKNAMPPPRK